MKKILQYIKVVLICGPRIIYTHFRYMIWFAKKPDKYPLQKRYDIARKEIRAVLKRFHIDYQIEGLEKFTNNNEKALLISNHLSFFDPLIIIANSEKPVTFVAKKETFKFPFVGKVAKALEVFPLDREHLLAQFSEIKKIVTYLKDPSKPSVIIYIEGTRNRHPENGCLPFHAGTLKIAQMADSNLMIAATYGGFRPLSMNSYLRKYPCYLNVFEELNKNDVKTANTSELALFLQSKVDEQIDKLRYFDKNYINNLKIKDKIKELETKVDIRAKA